jgi:hypothetical protein
MKTNLIDSVNQMSDQDIVNFSEEKFLEIKEALDELYNADITGLIVKGPPGIGKSFFCEEYLKKLGTKYKDLLQSKWEKVADSNPVIWELVELEQGEGPLVRKSDSSEWSIFADLFANRNEGEILMLDDNDDIMKDVTGLSILMAATEHKMDKKVDFTKAQFNTELRKYGVPPKFSYNGGVLILTNFDMEGEVRKYANDDEKSKPAHITRWEALLDRCDYIDMELDHPRVVRVYIENLIKKTGMYSKQLGYKAERLLTQEEVEMMMEWVRKNQINLKLSLTLRTTNELVKLISRYDNWMERANRKLCKHL